VNWIVTTAKTIFQNDVCNDPRAIHCGGDLEIGTGL
jgi:hypothetical protein